MSRPLVVGSIAFDLIFPIHGKIQDEILVEKNGKLGRQNLMFTAKTKESFFGGTGGNISYGLGLLGKKPMLFSLAGKDFRGEFETHLTESGVDSRVAVDEKGWTATFYGMSDELGQQIGVYQPNAYEKVHTLPLSKTISPKDFKDIGAAIFSAGTGMSILRHMKEVREKCGKDVTIIFDPGQVISIFYDKKLLEETLALADIFIGNEVECKQLQTILGYTHEKLLAKGLSAVIETLGEKGSILYEHDVLARKHGRAFVLKETFVQPVKAGGVVEATGAGDAYRAGMIAKLLEGKNLKEACTFGAKVASRSVAYRGGQTYSL
ncbi:MAG: PfkB domain protein [Parcubacteria group bacterium GW2011_GWA2_49_9]|nr:MAG: PfkB domain protein [Parcubacteria group bacterium GW2011_GWA2_49_9]